MGTTLTRDELYEAVWTKAKTDLAADLGVSDVAIGKACRKAEIPTPPVGYWAKVAAGKKAVRPPLPGRGFGMPQMIKLGFGPYQSHDDGQLPLDKPPPDTPTFGEPFEAVAGRAAAAFPRLRVPRTFDAAHKAIARLLKEDEDRRTRYNASKYPSTSDEPRYESPIEVRRLRILNALFLAFEAEGHSVRVIEARSYYNWNVDRAASFHVNGEFVSVKVEPVATKGEKTASRMALAIDGSRWLWDFPRHWQDGESGRVETKLADVARAILIAAEDHYRSGEVGSYQYRVEERARRLAERERERAESEWRAEQARFAHKRAQERSLVKLALAYRRAETIREFVAKVRSSPRHAEHIERAHGAWATWALEVADALDPLNRTEEWLGKR